MENLLKTQVLEPVEGFDHCRRQLERLADALDRAAQASDLPLIDFFRPFHDGAGQVRADLFLDDGLHPNHRGHALMADTAAKVLRDAFGF